MNVCLSNRGTKHRAVITDLIFEAFDQMNLSYQSEYCFEPTAPCKSAFMELPSTPGAHSYPNYNSVPSNYNPYTAAMRYYHPPTSQDYPLACKARNSFTMPPLNHHPLSHHPYLSPSLQAFGASHDSPHDGMYLHLELLLLLVTWSYFLSKRWTRLRKITGFPAAVCSLNGLNSLKVVMSIVKITSKLIHNKLLKYFMVFCATGCDRK